MSALRFVWLHSLVAVSLALCLPPTRALQAQPPDNVYNYYAAIAFSQSTGRYGYSSGWLAEINARREALKNCKAKDAKVILVVGNGYAALAVGEDTSAYGYGSAKTVEGADLAKRYALEACRKRTTNCKIVVIIHSWAG